MLDTVGMQLVPQQALSAATKKGGHFPSNFGNCLYRLVPKLNYGATHQLRLARRKSFSRLEVGSVFCIGLQHLP